MENPVEALEADSTASKTLSAQELANTEATNLHELFIAPLLPSWFKDAPSFVREALRESIRQGQVTQQAVSQALSQIKPIEIFCEPLLNSALAAHGWGL